MKLRSKNKALRREAFVVLVACLAAVRLFHAEKIVAWASRPPRIVRRFSDPDLPALVADAVARAAVRFKLTRPCLPSSLAVQLMLRRRGVASTLCLGVRRAQSALAAHAWVEIDRTIVYGATEEQYVSLGRYGEATGSRR